MGVCPFRCCLDGSNRSRLGYKKYPCIFTMNGDVIEWQDLNSIGASCIRY